MRGRGGAPLDLPGARRWGLRERELPIPVRAHGVDVGGAEAFTLRRAAVVRMRNFPGARPLALSSSATRKGRSNKTSVRSSTRSLLRAKLSGNLPKWKCEVENLTGIGLLILGSPGHRARSSRPMDTWPAQWSGCPPLDAPSPVIIGSSRAAIRVGLRPHVFGSTAYCDLFANEEKVFMHKAIVPSDNIGRWIDYDEPDSESRPAEGAPPQPPSSAECGAAPLNRGSRLPLSFRPFEALAPKIRMPSQAAE